MNLTCNFMTIPSNSAKPLNMKIPALLLSLALLPWSVFAADITGVWKSEFDSQIGQQKYTFTLKQDGTSLTGKANSEVGDQKREAELQAGKVEGDTVSFVELLNFQDNEIQVRYSGKLSADANEIKFTREVGEFAREEIVARRAQPGAADSTPVARPLRIKAGRETPLTDSSGQIWLAEQGFEGGATVDHDPPVAIAATKNPELFQSEHYSMEAFSCKIPNGKYLANLYFAETYEGITGPGERVFSFNVQGHEFKNFDVWVKAGGPNRAYVETVPVEVTNGIFRIGFTSNIENPQINAIEIIPLAPVDISAAALVPTPTAVGTAVPVAPEPAPTGPPATPVLQIDAGKVTGTVSPELYGLMTEEINFSYEGGIYGELIRNRTFKSSRQNPTFWNTVGDATMTIDTNQPLNAALDLSLKLAAGKASKASPVGIANGGFWGIPVKPDTTYRASFYARGNKFSGPLDLALESADGQTVFARATIAKISRKWKKYEATLTTGNVPPSKANRFVITTTRPGALWLQNVSLFPPNFNQRPNGTRPDIMQLLAEMQPKFLRFPGGNYLEGNTIAERFDWKATIGDVAQRPGHRSPWGYWSTDGFGLLEFLEWCEDLKMEPLLAVYGGYSLRGQRVETGTNLNLYVQEALEEIEYVTGDATTKWGARRVKDGHPEPFKLTYVEVGNEDFADRSRSYDGRFAQFYDAIKAKYPNLKVIATTKVQSREPDLLDEHYYRSQEDMQAHALDYDKYSRTDKTKIFVGEWATRVGSPTPNMAGALGDAAWMTGLERNSDLVLISCYAPLFVNVSQVSGGNRSMQWSTDLIGYDALSSYGSPAYYAQKMFSTMHGDEILSTSSENIPSRTWQPRAFRGNPPPPQQIRQIFFDATRDRQSGVIYLKVVNAAGTAQNINVQITGAPQIDSEGETVVLAAGSPEDTNSLEQPEHVVPRTEQAQHLGANFTREFPPYSITVLKLKTKALMEDSVVARAPTNEPADDWKPATSNQQGKQYPQVNSEGRVRERVIAPLAQSVQLDLGGVKYPLARGGDGAWIGFSKPQDEGFHYYQIIVDGAQVPDPNSLYYYGAGRWGSGVEIPAQDQDFYALKNVPHGQLREVFYASKTTNSIRHCFVYTPPDYDQDPNQRYPVLYLQHGAGENETGWGNQGHANLIMDNLLAEGKTKPFIIVMENGGGIGGPPRRGAAPPNAPPVGALAAGATNGAPARGPGGFGGRSFDFSAFERAMIGDLIPFIDSNYRTIPDQPHRAMAGLSMGGMQTHSITLAHLDTFSHIGIFSGGSIATNEITDLDAFKQKVKVVFFSFGGREHGAQARADAEALKQSGVNAFYYESPLTAHEWQSWRRSLHQFAPLLFQN
jgi:alpha-N-arabinofuranosidase